MAKFIALLYIMVIIDYKIIMAMIDVLTIMSTIAVLAVMIEAWLLYWI